MNNTNEAARTGEVAHTPTPWHVSNYRNPDSLRIEANERVVPGCASDTYRPLVAKVFDGALYPDEAQLRANAAFIVRACNSHAALAEALECLCEDFRVNVRDCDKWSGYIKARAALALAKGGQQ